MNRTTVLRLALLGALAILLVVPGASFAGPTKEAAPEASCQLSVFSWWTGGGEAAGLTKLITIWNKANPSCKFKNEAVAGGAGSEREGRARAAARREASRRTRSRATRAPSSATTSRPVRSCRSTSSTSSTASTR